MAPRPRLRGPSAASFVLLPGLHSKRLPYPHTSAFADLSAGSLHDDEPWREIERLFRRLKGFRRIFSRFEKLDALFLGFVHFALIYDAVR